MSKLSKRHFWEWFNRNNKEYLDLNNKSKKEATYWLNELNAHLRAYYKFFEYTLVLPNNGIPIFTITVHGKAMHFDKVEKLVATAPEIPGWSIQALEEPRAIDFFLEEKIEVLGIHPNECSFSFVSKDPDDKRVIVYHPLCTEENEFPFLQLASTAVYNLLGERSFALDTSYVEVENLSRADPDDVHPLEELPLHIALRKPTMVIGPNGTLQGIN
jgi:hypothetical protein